MAAGSNELGQRSAEAVLALRAESARRVHAARARRFRRGAALAVTGLVLLAAEGVVLRRYARSHVEPRVVVVAPRAPCAQSDPREVERRLERLADKFLALKPRRPLDVETWHGYERRVAKADIVRGMKDLQGRLELCSLDGAGPREMVMIDFTIGLSGRVKSAFVTGNHAHTAWSVCLRAAASTARFPQSSEEWGTPYPFVLSLPRAIAATSSGECVASAAPARSLSMADVEAKLAVACSGPEGLDDCAPEVFAATFAAELPFVERNRTELEALWLDELRRGDSRAAYGLAWLGSTRALPELRRRLLADRDMLGWPRTLPGEPEPLPPDHLLPHQSALIMAIEHLSGRSLRSVVKLTRTERRELVQEATAARTWFCHAPSQDGLVARWLLHKLDRDPPARRDAWVRNDCLRSDNPLEGL